MTHSKSATYAIAGKQYPIAGYIEDEQFGTVPVVDIPMMDDYKWQLKCLQSRLEHYEKYAQYEDVDATIARLQQWLEAHPLSN